MGVKYFWDEIAQLFSEKKNAFLGEGSDSSWNVLK